MQAAAALRGIRKMRRLASARKKSPLIENAAGRRSDACNTINDSMLRFAGGHAA
jgi:hypothetical protein